MTDRERQRVVRDDSDALLGKMHELKDLESRKRHLEISTPAFHDAADAVTDASREIFSIAHHEQVAGSRIDERQGIATEDVEPKA
jgi:hypothetical protein